MSDDPIPISRATAVYLYGPEFEADHRAIGEWLDDGARPDFEAIGRRLVASIDVMVGGRWVVLTEHQAKKLEEARAALEDLARPRGQSALPGAVSGLVQVARDVIRDRPDPPPPRGPLAGQMYRSK